MFEIGQGGSYEVDLHCPCHPAARLRTAAAHLGTGEHLLITIRHVFAFLSAARALCRTDTAYLMMGGRVNEHKIRTGLANLGAPIRVAIWGGEACLSPI
jgi:hypothetical protein